MRITNFRTELCSSSGENGREGRERDKVVKGMKKRNMQKEAIEERKRLSENTQVAPRAYICIGIMMAVEAAGCGVAGTGAVVKEAAVVGW